MFERADEAVAAAIPRTDPLFAEWAAEASRGAAVVVGGFCERGDDGHVYNSAALVDGTGVRAVHRKTHLWDREKLWFRPGDEPPPVVDTAVGRIGMLICYELEFPELDAPARVGRRRPPRRADELAARRRGRPASTRPRC